MENILEITFSNKIDNEFSLLVVLASKKSEKNSSLISDKSIKNFVSKIKKLSEFKKQKNFSESFFVSDDKNNLKRVHLLKIDDFKNCVEVEAFSGQKFTNFETAKNLNINIISEEINLKNINNEEFIAAFASGFNLKNYSFRKYRSEVRKIKTSIKKINFVCSNFKSVQKSFNEYEKISKGVFLTRDLVSEPANQIYPESFVENCRILAKAGVELEVFDEKKLKKLKMRALLGVAQGSVKPARVLVMKWKGLKSSFKNPLAFVGKGVTFDTGGISLKPSGGMEDMKWDMGGAAVVSGLMYALALRKAKANVIGIVGLVENMPDGNAQRPGDIVTSMSGQTIEVLNTDAEGRLVLADVLWYVNKFYKPELIVDLATLTGAIIVALGNRYAGLFSNNDDLANKLLKSSTYIKELIWRLPLDSEFDKLLNCNIADMKNITGTRGAGSITAAQFLKRFVGNTKWAHLDIAGVTWSNSGTSISRSGGTGFGVRLLNNFVKENYE